jgi:hypothetical protein
MATPVPAPSAPQAPRQNTTIIGVCPRRRAALPRLMDCFRSTVSSADERRAGTRPREPVVGRWVLPILIDRAEVTAASPTRGVDLATLRRLLVDPDDVTSAVLRADDCCSICLSSLLDRGVRSEEGELMGKCSSENVELLETLCGHVFHSTCATRWLVAASSCPTCRAPVEDATATQTRDAEGPGALVTGDH